jgi:hypothetical protein
MKNAREYIFERLKKNVDFVWLNFLCEDNYYIAGNSLNTGNPNDIDIFPTTENQFVNLKSKVNDEWDKVVSVSKNAVTIIHKNVAYQFCNYYHESLEDLVNSFDFSHIQIGGEIKIEEDFNDSPSEFKDLFMSEDYIQSKIIGDTEYLGSEFPTSSMIRIFKYFKRGDFSGKSYIVSVINILVNIAERGFKNYEDFKDQLDAVDLGLLPSDLNLFRPWDKMLKRFYNAFTKSDKLGENNDS